VDNGAAGEVEAGEGGVDVGGVEQSAHAPDHVGHGAIDEQGPKGEKDGHGAELHALGKGAGDQRRGDDGEHELVDHEGLLGDGGGVVGVRRDADAAQEEVLKASDEGVAMAEGQRVADNGPENGDQAHHGEALHHGAQDVLLADQAAVEERQTGSGHQQDQGGGGQHPGVVAGGLGVGGSGLVGLDGLLESGDLGLRVWRGRLSEGQGRDCQQGGEKHQFDSTTGHTISTPR
jgi:hypothetical protein